MYRAFARITLTLFVTNFLIIFIYGVYNVIYIAVYPLLYLFVASVSQAALFCLPNLLFYQSSKLTKKWSWRYRFWSSLILTYSVLCILVVISNYKLFSMYGYFVNSFVFNILLTPGGIEALGVSNSSYVSSVLLTAVIAALMWVVLKWVPFEKATDRVRTYKHRFLTGMIFLVVLQTFGIAYADYKNDLAILDTSDKIVWHFKATMKYFFSKIGIKGSERKTVKAASGKLNYPRIPLQNIEIQKPYNIVWLVAESWRADMLTTKIMPETFSFGEDNTQFLNHYSSGNGTRMGLFGQFYGLYGFYWFDMLERRKSPVILDVLMANNYQKKAFTSARFSYPEFDKTLFADFKPEELQSYSKGEGWERDRKNVTDLISFMDETTKPFFGFMFFESAHANYYFPEESVIENDYLKNFDYLVTDIPANIKQIKNRYINASHHLDSQLARVFSYLKESNKLDNTIVIVTGDHGEEFLEKGRWGHNSTFSQEQIRIPLVIHHPDMKMKPVVAMTSHIDLPATVLNFLGIADDPSHYSYGQNLYSPSYSRDSLVVSDWNGSALITPEIKYSLSIKASAGKDRVTSLNDEPIADESNSLTTQVLSDYIKSTGVFYSKK